MSEKIDVQPIGRNAEGAAEYLRKRFGIKTTAGSLARYRFEVAQGKPNRGPDFERVGTKIIFYLDTKLDEWALSGRNQPYHARGGLKASTPAAEPEPSPAPRRSADRGR